MSHYPPDTAEGETLGFWQRVTRMQRKKESFKWVSEEQNIGMITAHWICISTGSICDSESITLTHLLTAKAFLKSTHFSAERFGKVNQFSPKTSEDHSWSTTYQHECFELAGLWPHRVGIYLELTRGSVNCSTWPSGGPWTSRCVRGRAWWENKI